VTICETVPVFAALLLTIGCGKEAPSERARILHEILIVLPDAEDVKYTKEYDGTVSYRLAEPHPADRTLGEIRSRLQGQGWKPVSDDLMNPGMTNSNVRGWMNYIDGTRNEANVFLWSAAWESTRGDRVEYWIRYEYAKTAGPMSAKPPLQLSAMYMTASTVNVIREDVRRRGSGEVPRKP
jgi:hypothetical protein